MTEQTPPRSIRLSGGLNSFVDNSDYEFSREVRSHIEADSIERAVGKCAITGDIVYMGGFTTIGTSTPLGEALDAPTELESFDLRDDIAADLSESIFAESSEPEYDELEYLNSVGTTIYAAEVKAIGDATQDSAWREIANINSNLSSQLSNMVDLLLWSYITDQDGDFSTENIWGLIPEHMKDNIESAANQKTDSPTKADEFIVEIIESVE